MTWNEGEGNDQTESCILLQGDKRLSRLLGARDALRLLDTAPSHEGRRKGGKMREERGGAMILIF